MYLKTRDGKILKVTSICMCEECQKRKMPELCLKDMNGNYYDYIKVSDLFNEKYVLSDDFYKLNQKEGATMEISKEELFKTIEKMECSEREKMTLKNLALIAYIEEGHTEILEKQRNSINYISNEVRSLKSIVTTTLIIQIIIFVLIRINL